MQRFTPRGVLIIFVLAIGVAVLTVAALVPSSRNAIRAFLLSTDRRILAKTSGYVTPEGPYVSIFKILEDGGLALEIYTAPDSDGNPNLLQRIVMDETRDGYFSFMGNATNLALSDTDSDGAMDILAPTFDNQMTARLHVYRFNRALGTFEKVIPPPPDAENSPPSR